MTIATLVVNIEANTAKLVKDVEGIQGSLDKVGSIAGKLGGVLAGAFSIGAVTAAARSFLDTAGALTDLSQKTGISTTELQKLKFAAEQNGGTLEDVTRGVTKMGKALVEGDASTVAAMKRLGLSFADVRNMDPASAFATIGDAIAKIPNPLERSKLAMDLFGKSGADLLPIMTGNLSDTMKAAERLGIVLDEQTVAAGDNLGDTLTALQSVGGAVIGKMLAPMLPAFQMVATAMLSAGNVVDYLRDMFDALVRVGLLAVKGLVDAAIKVGELGAKVPGLSRVLGEDAAAMQGMRDASTWLGGAIKGLEQGTESATVATTKNHAALQPLPDLHRATARAVAEHTAVSAEQAHILELLEIARRHQVATMKEEEAAYVANQKAAGIYIANLPTAIFRTTSYAGAVEQVSAAAATYQGNMAGATRSTTEASHVWERAYGALGDVSAILNNIPGMFAEVASVAARTGQAIMTNLADGNIWGAIVAGATGVLQIFSKIWGSAGRDEVEKFAQSFGGFDAIHAKLLTLGDAGEQLWIKLTQGVGRNNPEQAKKVIEEINQALAGQDAWMQRLPELIERYGLSWAEAGQKARQAHLDEIAAGLIQDFADLSRAGFDVVTITEHMSGAINDYVHNAMLTGTEIPAAMRPLLQKMVDLGLLTDAAGEKMTDLSGISFAETLTEGFHSVVDAIRELTRALTGDLSGALEALQRRGVVIPYHFQDDGQGDGGSDGGRGGRPSASVSAFAATSLSRTGSVLPFTRAASGGDAGLRRELAGLRSDFSTLYEQQRADRMFLLTQMPKAIAAAQQRGKAS